MPVRRHMTSSVNPLVVDEISHSCKKDGHAAIHIHAGLCAKHIRSPENLFPRLRQFVPESEGNRTTYIGKFLCGALYVSRRLISLRARSLARSRPRPYEVAEADLNLPTALLATATPFSSSNERALSTTLYLFAGLRFPPLTLTLSLSLPYSSHHGLTPGSRADSLTWVLRESA